MKVEDEFKTQQAYNEYLRKYFAGLAMQGLLSNPNNSNSVDEITKKAVIYSDGLLKQLQK
jgi:hypothetical protein